MKKSLALAGTLLAAGLAGSSAHAQGIRLGVKAGSNLSNLSGNLANEDTYRNKYGFHGGLMLNIGTKLLSLQPEVLYSQKGFKYDDGQVTRGGVTMQYQGDRTYNYLDIPVLVKLRVAGLYVEAGPQYGYLLNIKDNSSYSVNGGTNTTFIATQSLDHVNRHEIGYAAGLGFESASGLVLGIRYNGSFTDFADNTYSDPDISNARNSVFQLSLGFLMPGR